MLKKNNFILFSLLLISSPLVIANDCCKDTSCIEKNKCADKEAAPCDEQCMKEKEKEVLVEATKVAFKVTINGEEAAGEVFVVDGRGLTINGNGVVLAAQLICCEDNKLRIDAALYTSDDKGQAKDHGMISHDANWGEIKEFAWEDSLITLSLMALEKCTISVPQEALAQA